MSQYKYSEYKEICQRNGISSECFYQRLRYGWTIEKTTTTPPRHKKEQKDSQYKRANKSPFAIIKANEDTNAFMPHSNYPSQEYSKYLGQQLKNLEMTPFLGNDLTKMVKQSYENEKRNIDSSSFFYSAMDMYVTNPEMAKNIYSEDLLKEIKMELEIAKKEVTSLTYGIYYLFSTQFNLNTIITRQQVHQSAI